MFGFWKAKIKGSTHVWATGEACRAGFLGDVRARLGERCLVLVVTHFPDTHSQLDRALEEGGIPKVSLAQSGDLDPRRLAASAGNGRVVMIPYPVIQLGAPFVRAHAESSTRAAVLAPEIHPTAGRDEQVESFVRSLPFERSLDYYVSLDSPIMRVFGAERLMPIISRLGLAENERLEHPFLFDAVRKAQKRIGSVARGDQPAASVAEWFNLNAPQLPGAPDNR